MDLAQALQDALYVFEEERVRPTLSYRYIAEEWPKSMKWEEHTLRPQGYSPAVAADIGLGKERETRPREVEENPKAFQFESVNFNLLLTIMNQLAPQKRAELVAALVNVLLKAAPINRHQNQISFLCGWRSGCFFFQGNSTHPKSRGCSCEAWASRDPQTCHCDAIYRLPFPSDGSTDGRPLDSGASMLNARKQIPRSFSPRWGAAADGSE
jgi:hypothetical protein